MSEQPPSVLVVDDDRIVAASIAELLARDGYRVATAASGEEALIEVEQAQGGAAPQPYAVAIVDMSLPGMSGLELIKALRREHRDIVALGITGYPTVEAAVAAIRTGAMDYLSKPVVDDELRIAVEKAIRQQALLAENTNLRAQLDQRYGLDNIIGSDPRMRRIYDVIEAVAPGRTTVLMTGESGTGKSLIARAAHRRSPRADKPFVEISCGSIPETLLESELFGHAKGAFTGAHAEKTGRFRAAHTGTLFLDEINSASPGMQLKLLRVLQERRFEPVGSNETVEVDVRVILASNQPLESLVASGEFRQDLYYRINVVKIELPALRERIGDIPLLAEHFLEAKAKEAGKRVTEFTAQALEALRRYAWPGNVRELENVVERAVVLTRSPRIEVEDLPPHVIDNSTGQLLPAHAQLRLAGPASWSPDRPLPLRDALQEPERQIIVAALEANGWNRQKTAEQLDINRTTLYKKIKQYGLEAYGQAG
ncbi:MAG: sigma-54-dependent transcriptional regulator [Planctomycetota bacterium]|jgi:DNA-binding NtrC family response regulator